jgi:FtsH-binding integral membrane protein
MTSDDGFQLLWFVLAFTLAISAVIAHRIPLGMTLKMALAWTGIFAFAALIAWGWQMVR